MMFPFSVRARGAPQQTGAVPLSQGIADVAAQLAKSIPEGHPMTVAVTDFPDLGGQTCRMGRYVAERLTTLLSQHAQCRLIERRRLDLVLQELKFSMSELVDPTKARKLGQMLGVQGLVIGTISDVGSTLDLDARIIDIQTSVSLPGASASIIQDDMLKRLTSDCLEAGNPNQIQGATSSMQRDAQSSPGNAPVYQSASIRATVGQLGVSSDNQRVGLSVIIENISRNSLYLAFTNTRSTWSDRADVSLSDDRATGWYIDNVSGIHTLQSVRSGSDLKQGDFTVISPSERITVVMNFKRSSGAFVEAPGTTFSFGAQGVFFTPAGVQNVSIGLAGIKATVRAK
jgi:TolB-like protein